MHGENETGKPLVTVIIPTYNRADFVPQTIESCLNQTYRNVEVIVVDDGSTDSTPQILARLSREHDATRFTHLTQVNAGQCAANNAGVDIARGKYIKFLDSDDTLEPDAIEHYVNALESTNADLCIASRRYMGANGEKWRVNFQPPEGLIDRPLERFYDLDIRPQTGMWCFRRSIFDRGTRWDARVLARTDTDLIGRILAAGGSVAGAPKAIYNQRCHDVNRQSSRQFEPRVLTSIIASYKRVYDIMVDTGTLSQGGRSFARSMSRTALRAWSAGERRASYELYSLAKKSHRWPELVLLDAYPWLVRAIAYVLWLIGGIRLCGPLFAIYQRAKQLRSSRA